MRRTRARTVTDAEAVLERAGSSDKVNIPTDLLRTFVAIHELGSFTKAAHLFDLTQPAVSAHMKKLESLIGADLIEKNVAGVHLTLQGEEVLKYARRILSINDQIVNSGIPQRAAPVVRLGIPNLFAAAKLRPLSVECRAKAGNSRVQLSCDNSQALLRSVRSGYLDLACVMSDDQEIESAVRAWSEELVWARAADLLLESDGVVPIVSSPNMLLPDRLAIEALHRADRPYEIAFTAFDTLVRRAAAIAGLGCLALPRQVVPDELVIEQPGILPVLPNVTLGIVAREDFDTDDLMPLIDSVEQVLSTA
jgi:DNA-binding transcriptional LysR family regulator